MYHRAEREDKRSVSLCASHVAFFFPPLLVAPRYDFCAANVCIFRESSIVVVIEMHDVRISERIVKCIRAKLTDKMCI